MRVKWSESCSVVSDSLRPHGLYSPWNSPGQIQEWVAFPFSRVSSPPRNRAQVSCIAGGFSTSWATRECLNHEKCCSNLSKRWWQSGLRNKRIMYGFNKYLGLQEYPELMDARSDIFGFEQSTHCDWKLH